MNLPIDTTATAPSAAAASLAQPTAGNVRDSAAAPLPATRIDTPAVTAQTRFDIYAPIHKGLRDLMTQTLAQVGRLDVDDAAESAATLAQVEDLLDFCLAHMHHENEFVHAAIEARLPRCARRTADDHVEHLASIEALRKEARALATAAGSERPARALRLYRHLALFVAENFQHMHVEETVNNAALWSCYSDGELLALHDRLLAAISPQETLQVARWMVPAINPAERAAALGGAKAGMPPEAFLGLLESVRPHLDAHHWTRLARTLGVCERLGRPAAA